MHSLSRIAIVEGIRFCVICVFCGRLFYAAFADDILRDVSPTEYTEYTEYTEANALNDFLLTEFTEIMYR